MKRLFALVGLFLCMDLYSMANPNQPRVRVPAKILEIIVSENIPQNILIKINKLYKQDTQMRNFMDNPDQMNAVIAHIARQTNILPFIIGLSLGSSGHAWLKHQYKNNVQVREQIKGYLDTAFRNDKLIQLQNAVRAIPELAHYVFNDEKKTTMLLRAIIHNNGKHLVQDLIEKGADVHQSNTDGVTPLMMAARLNQLEIIVLLLAAEATVNSSGKSPVLLEAIKFGSANAVMLLLDAGAIVNDETIAFSRTVNAVWDTKAITALLQQKKENPNKKFGPLPEKL